MNGLGHAIIPAVTAFIVAYVAIVLLCRLAPMLGLLDLPGGRKDHGHPIPLVGGIALGLTLVSCKFLLGGGVVPVAFLAAAIVLVTVSIWDDFRDLHYVTRFAFQIAAVLVMVYVAEVRLNNLGNLFGWRSLGLWALAVPVTVFSVVGVINAVNMIDGMDGLAASISLVAFGWYGVAATLLGNAEMAALAWLLCGALAGFLLLNLRMPWQPQARVFLGDAGSTLLGFALAWFAIDLSQGTEPTMAPIAAVWVILIPLADTLSLVVRRLSRRQSPFHPDREHIHHFLLASGLSVTRALALLVGVSAALGAVGIVGWRMGVPEPVLFWSLMLLYFAYHYAITAAWKRLHARGVEVPALPTAPKT